MTDKKKISLNFGRIGKAQVDSVATETLGDVPQEEQQASAAPSVQPGFFLISHDEIVLREKDLVTLFNFARQKITFGSADPAVNEKSIPFTEFKSPAVISEAYKKLRQLGGNPKPYKGSDSQRQKQEPAKRSRQGRRFLWPF